MRMLVRFGDPLTPAHLRDTAWLDTSQPQEQAVVDGIGWFYHKPFLTPGIMRLGAVVSDGLNMYEVLEVEGPLFEVGGVYCQRFMDRRDKEEGPAIQILARKWGWYLFSWKPWRRWCWYIKREDTLLKFLTGED